MKIFIDTADLEEIRELASWGVIDGVTTNPTLVAKSGRPFNEIIDEIFKIVDGPISLEAVSEKADDMVAEAKGIVGKIPQKHRKNIAIKIPMTPEGLKAAKALKKEGIPLLRLETDYGDGDMGQLRTRIDAFLEMIRR